MWFPFNPNSPSIEAFAQMSSPQGGKPSHAFLSKIPESIFSVLSGLICWYNLSHLNIIFQIKLFFSILLPRMSPTPSLRSECNILKGGTEKSFLLTLFFSASRSFWKGSVWLHKSFWYFRNWFWLCDEPVLHFHMYSKEYMSLSWMSPDLREVETVVDSGRCLRTQWIFTEASWPFLF